MFDRELCVFVVPGFLRAPVRHGRLRLVDLAAPQAMRPRQETPAGRLVFGHARSLIITELESHEATPPLPLKLTPEKSTLEFTNTSMAGPLLAEICPPRRKASELPSTRIPALRGSADDYVGGLPYSMADGELGATVLK